MNTTKTKLKPISWNSLSYHITNRAAVLEIVQHCTFGLFDDDCVEEAFPSDCCHDVFGQFGQLAPQQLSHPLSVLCQLLLLQHLQTTTVTCIFFF